MNDAISFDDIWDLWRSGAVHLPNLGNQYGLAAQSVHKTGLSEGQAFDGAVPELATAFSELRNTLQDRILVESSKNLVDSGSVLATLAEQFAELDKANSTKLDNSIGDLDEAGPDLQPPPYIEPAPKSDDKHPENDPHRPGGM